MTGSDQQPAWRAPRWLLISVPVLLVVVLLVVRAVLDGGEVKESAKRELPAPEQVASAQEIAEGVLRTWAQPDLDYATWWQGLKPLLTPRAREGYEFTDPRRIPDLTITGEPSVEPGPTTDTLTVGVPTDAGTYSVALYRSDQDAVWRGVQIVFPDQLGPFQ